MVHMFSGCAAESDHRLQVSRHVWQLHDEDLLEIPPALQADRRQPHEEVLQGATGQDQTDPARAEGPRRRRGEASQEDASCVDQRKDGPEEGAQEVGPCVLADVPELLRERPDGRFTGYLRKKLQ